MRGDKTLSMWQMHFVLNFKKLHWWQHYSTLHCQDSSWLKVSCTTKKWTCQLLHCHLSYCSPVWRHCERSLSEFKTSAQDLPGASQFPDLSAWDAAQEEKRGEILSTTKWCFVRGRNSRSTKLTLTACFQAGANSWMAKHWFGVFS